jgi:hypothetical protein
MSLRPDIASLEHLGQHIKKRAQLVLTLINQPSSSQEEGPAVGAVPHTHLNLDRAHTLHLAI